MTYPIVNLDEAGEHILGIYSIPYENMNILIFEKIYDENNSRVIKIYGSILDEKDLDKDRLGYRNIKKCISNDIEFRRKFGDYVYIGTSIKNPRNITEIVSKKYTDKFVLRYKFN